MHSIGDNSRQWLLLSIREELLMAMKLMTLLHVYWILWYPWTNNMIDISYVSATWNLIIVLFSQHDSKLNVNLRCMSYAKVSLNSDKFSFFHMVGTQNHQLPDTYLMLFSYCTTVITQFSLWVPLHMNLHLKETHTGEVLGPSRSVAV
jgi:hypothetical protein